MRNLHLPKIPHSGRQGSLPEIGAMSIEELQRGYATEAFAVADVAAAVMQRIAEQEPYLNALVAVNGGIFDDARRLDAERAAGQGQSPLHGVPIVIKDNMTEAGVRVTAGYAGFASDDRVVDVAAGTFDGIDLVPARDATIVAGLRAAGALIVGRSNLPDFGLDGLRADSSHNGDTLNPYDRRFAPGVSSTGSATAVAAGFGIASLGTDTAGSILFPASAQSLVGLKPSFGLVPGDGIYPGLSSHHDVAGPITKTVRDAAVLLDIIAGKAAGTSALGYASGLKKGALAGKMIGLFEPGQWAGELHPDVAKHYRRMVGVIEGLGARTENIVFADTDWAAAWNARTFFDHCNAYWAGVDAFLAGLGVDGGETKVL